jgi:hypothetical protein
MAASETLRIRTHALPAYQAWFWGEIGLPTLDFGCRPEGALSRINLNSPQQIP